MAAVESHRRTRTNGGGGGGGPPPSSSGVVWVGSLNGAVNEAELTLVFSNIGRVESCKIMRDDQGASRGFAYITFHSEKDAEQAAKIFNGFSFRGHTIKTKGPSTLRQEGHTPRTPPVSSNYRPYTDCSFFMLGNHCKKGTDCPYRHSTMARKSNKTCSNWLEKKCLDLTCPFRHPGNKEPVPGARADLKLDNLISGVPKYSNSFGSKEALNDHLGESHLLKCPYCASMFQSDSEYLEHLQKCYNNPSSLSPSADDWKLSSRTTDNSDSYVFSSESSNGTTPRHRSHSGSEASGRGGQLRNNSRPSSSSSASDHVQITSSESGMGPSYSESTGDMDLAELEYFYGNDDDDSDNDSDDGAVVYSRAEMARLLSLNERDMQEDEEDDEEEEEEELAVDYELGRTSNPVAAVKAQKRKGSPAMKKDKKKPSSSPGHPKTKEPVGMFWDIENCSVPVNKSAFGVASKLRREFIAGKREAEFMCVCDITKERKEVTDDLNKAQVTLVHVNAIAKNAADDKLRQSLRRFANTYPPPATVVLISGDVNFSAELNDLTNCHNLTVVLVHNTQASDALKVFASRLVNYDQFIADIQPPSKAQNPSDLPRVVAVSGLPRHVPQGQLSNRLGRLSDNCGGKVLRVDMATGTAKILFRTNEWAMKAQKRMNNEDVFGIKISTSVEMEPNPPSGKSNFQQLSGPSLGKSYPPPQQRPPGGQISGPAHRTPPLPARHNAVPVQPQIRQPRQVPHQLPPAHPYQQAVVTGGAQPRPGGPPYPLMHPNVPPQGMMRVGGPVRPGIPFDPRMQPPGGIRPNQFPMQQPPPPHMVRGPPHPAIPMMSNYQGPRFKQPPCANIKDLPTGPIPRHEGRILVFKVPPPQEFHMEHNVLALKRDAFFSAQHRVLWHSYFEIQVLFKLDFIQTAAIRKEEIIQALYEKGNLPIKVAEEFVETCTKSIGDVLRRHNSQWEVTMCGWTSEEEENRIIRSNALTILRSRHPLTWINFNEFKRLYQQRYGTAISEFSIHTACAGAVQILSNNSNKGQVVVIHEFSPLVKILNDPKLHEKLRLDFSRFLSGMPQKRVKLLDFVPVFQSKWGPLPLSPSGKILQDVLTSTPNVEVEGTEPSNTFVILRQAGIPSLVNNKKKKDISVLAANFQHLLKAKGSAGIPTKCFQQEYQTFFHHSFRISDYLGTEGNMQDLFNQIPEIKVASVKKEKRVFLASQEISPSESPSSPMQSPRTPQQAPVKVAGATAPTPTSPASQKSTAASGGVKPLSEVNGNFRKLLIASSGRMLPFHGFQQQYQTFFHVSFKLSSYGTNIKMRELVEKCPGVEIISLNGEDYVCLAEEVQKIKSKFKSSGLIPVPKSGSATPKKATATPMKATATPVKATATPVKATATPVKATVSAAAQPSSENLAAEGPSLANISQFRNHCVRVLNTVEGKCLLAQFPEHYLKVIGTKFQPSYYKAKKLLPLLEAISDCVQVYNDNREMKLIDEVSGKKKCEARLVELVYAQEGHKLSLDRLMTAYEAKYGHKLEFHGHPKLLKLLESFSDTLMISGSGCNRPVTLTPLQLFACEMAELLPRYQVPMPINKIVPSYKEHFKRDLSVTAYGFSKLIKLLEAVPEVLEIKGEGATRTVSLLSPDCTPLLCRSPAGPPDQHVVDGILALLLGTNLQKLSVIELTKKYNASFRKGLDQLNDKDLINVVNSSPNFKIVGTGPLMYVHVVQGGSSPKSSSTKPTDRAAQEGGAGPTDLIFVMPPEVEASAQQSLAGKLVGHVTNAESGALATKLALDKDLLYKDMPELVGVADNSDTESTCSSCSSWLEDGDEAKRMVNETRRLLLAHQEHAMTLAELVESFRAQEDPSNVSIQTLYQYLNNEAAAKKFKVSPFPGMLDSSMVQLVSSDCLWKLGEDLLQLFVFRPTHNLCHPLSALPTLYQECFSRKLITAVYSAKDLEQVLRSKVLKKVIHVDSTTKMCCPGEAFKVQVVVNLLVELLFYRGKDCINEDRVLTVYSSYFGANLPLDALGMKTISELFRRPKVQQFIQCSPAKNKKMKPVLKKRTQFVEQIRHLLTKTRGRFALYQFSNLYAEEFGAPLNDEVATFLRKGKLPRYCMNVANYSGLKWAVWAPNAYPVPSHRQAVKEALPQPDSIVNASTSQGDMDFSTIQREASDIIDRINNSLDDVEILSEESSSNALTSDYQETLPTPSDSDLGSGFTSSPRFVLQSSSNSSELLHPGGMEDQNKFAGRSNDDDTASSSSPGFVLPSSSNSSELLRPVGMKDQTTRAGRSSDDDNDSNDDSDSRMLAVAYDFIKNDPELLAQLSEKPEGTMAAIIDTTAMPEDDVKVLTEVLNLQRLHHSGLSNRPSDGNNSLGSSHKTREEELASSRVPVPPGAHSGAISTGARVSDGELPLLLGSGPVDFLEQGLGPDQVLDQLQKFKEASGGIIKADQMTPFFDYFGELSSRELDRIEKLEAEANPHKKAGNGEVRKKKRNIAIRFPSQSKSAAPPPGKELSLSDFSVPVGRLPVANFDDLSSDESGGEVKPFSREEFIREALRKEGREKDMADLLGGSCGGDGHVVTDSLLNTDDLNTLSKLDSARNDLESFLRQERDL